MKVHLRLPRSPTCCLNLLAGLYCWAGPVAFSTTRQQELTRPTSLLFWANSGPIQSTTLERVLQHTANHDFENKRKKKIQLFTYPENFYHVPKTLSLANSVHYCRYTECCAISNRSRFLLNSFSLAYSLAQSIC